MDMSRMVLGRLLAECQLSSFFLLPIYYKHSRGIPSETVTGHEPMFLVVAEKAVTNKRDLIVGEWNSFHRPLKNVTWHEGFSFVYYTWHYCLYTSLQDSDCIPDLRNVFRSYPHIKLEGISSTVNISTLIKVVGERVVDPSKIGHVFLRGVRDKNYMEAFVCVTTETHIDVSQETLNALNIAHHSMVVRGAVEHCLTGKKDIEWYSMNKQASADKFEAALGTGTTVLGSLSTSGTTGPAVSGPGKASGRIPGGRGGGRAEGRRVSPTKLSKPWNEVVVDEHNQEVRLIQDQIKLLTDKVSSLKLRK
jgi:hypothetical protein